MATQAMDPRRLRLLQQRLFAYDMPGGIPSVPYHLRENCSGAWLYGQALDPEGLYAIDDLHQGTPRPVQPGRCVNFDGVDDYVSMGDLAAANFAGDFSISVWVNPDDVSNYRPIVTKYESGKGWDLILNTTDGKVRFTLRGGSQIDCLSTGNNAPGTWIHIVAVGTLTSASVYINGVLRTTQSGTWTPVQTTQALTIGRRYDGFYFDGKIFDARIYNRALTDSEVSAIYNTSKPGGRPEVALYPGNLVGHWKLDDVNMKFVRDSSGNAYHGTWNGFTLGSNGHWTAMYTGADVPFSWHNEVGYGLKTSANVVSQGRFPAGQTEWVASAQSSISTGFATVKSTDGTHQTVGLVDTLLRAGRRYRVSHSVIANRGGSLASDTFGGLAVGSTPGRHSFIATAAYTSNYDTPVNFSIKRSGGVCDIDITDIVIEELDEIPQNSAVPSKDILGNTLTYTGPVPRNAKLIDSYCGTFDGVDDVSEAADASDVTRFNNGSNDLPFSASAWVKLSAVGASRCIVSRGSVGASTYEWAVIATTTGQVYVSVYSSVGDRTKTALTVPAVLADAAWHNITATYDGSATYAGLKVYVDGVEVATTDASLSTGGAYVGMNHNGTSVFVGRFPDSGAFKYPWVGQLADVRVYNSALSAADILLLYQGKTISASPVGHWPLAEGNGAILYDASGNGNHATLTGATLATFWGTRQSNVHRNIRRGFRDADNLLTYSQDIGDASWNKTGTISVAANTIEDPQGNLTADNVTITSSAYMWKAPSPAFVNGTQYTMSFWAKVPTGTKNITFGSVTGGAVPVSTTTVALTTSWQRFTFTFTAGATDVYCVMQKVGSATADDIHFWGVQLVKGAAARNYTPTTATAFDRVRIPTKNDGIGAADGNTITNPAGQWHNQAETELNFAPVAAPWTEGLSAPTSYAYGDTLPANGFKEIVTVGTVPREQGFYITKV